MSYETYHIPVNFTDAGRLFGMFEIRNAVEAVLISIPVLFFCIAFLPLACLAALMAAKGAMTWTLSQMILRSPTL